MMLRAVAWALPPMSGDPGTMSTGILGMTAHRAEGTAAENAAAGTQSADTEAHKVSCMSQHTC